MILSQALGELFPSANFEEDIILRDDGDGVVYVFLWNLADQQPSEAVLDSAWESFLQRRGDKEAERALAEQKASDARKIHEGLEGQDWSTSEIKSIIVGVLDRLDRLDSATPVNSPE